MSGATTRDQEAALERLIALAKGNTGQCRTVADFLLATWIAGHKALRRTAAGRLRALADKLEADDARPAGTVDRQRQQGESEGGVMGEINELYVWLGVLADGSERILITNMSHRGREMTFTFVLTERGDAARVEDIAVQLLRESRTLPNRLTAIRLRAFHADGGTRDIREIKP